ncbi:MAG: hypothetical protein V5A23_00390 [Halobacteriales archaeon]
MTETRRRFLRAVGLGSLAVAAGCSTGPGDGTDGGTDTDGGATATRTESPTDTDSPTATATSTSPEEGNDSSAETVVRAVVDGMETGDTDVIAEASIGYENWNGEWSPEATVVLPAGGDTLATELVQGDATAGEAYGNFEPVGRYFEVQAATVESINTVERLKELLTEMDGPDPEDAVEASVALDYRINLEGSWYDSETTTKAFAADLDGSWYVSTGITPWHLVVDLVPDEAQFTTERLAEIKRTVSLPLGDAE